MKKLINDVAEFLMMNRQFDDRHVARSYMYIMGQLEGDTGIPVRLHKQERLVAGIVSPYSKVDKCGYGTR